MKKLLTAITLIFCVLTVLPSCNKELSDDVEIIKHRSDMTNTYQIDSLLEPWGQMINMQKDELGDDDRFDFTWDLGSLESPQYRGLAVRYQGKKLKWPTIPKETHFIWGVDQDGQPNSTSMGGNRATFFVNTTKLIIYEWPAAGNTQGFRIWFCTGVPKHSGMDGIVP